MGPSLNKPEGPGPPVQFDPVLPFQLVLRTGPQCSNYNTIYNDLQPITRQLQCLLAIYN